MNGAHWHLVLNHLPIIIPMAATILMLLSIAMNNLEFSKAAYVLFILGALATIPAFLTGEGAEETLEGFKTMDEAFVHRHEEAAELFAILNYALGFLSLAGLWLSLKNQKFVNTARYVVFVFSLVVLFAAKNTGTTGGEISHPEIRTSQSATAGNAGEQQENEDDD